jgi:hypothetical protein
MYYAALKDQNKEEIKDQLLDAYNAGLREVENKLEHIRELKSKNEIINIRVNPRPSGNILIEFRYKGVELTVEELTQKIDQGYAILHSEYEGKFRDKVTVQKVKDAIFKKTGIDNYKRVL